MPFTTETILRILNFEDMTSKTITKTVLGCFIALLFLDSQAAEIIETDVCVYGGTAGGVVAAVQAARMGKSAVVAEFDSHLGGMTSGGLGATDIGNKAAIGGIAREFYQRVAQHYARGDAWQFETREEYFAQRGGRTTLAELNSPGATMWTFEPHVAEDILFRMINEAKVPVYFQQRLALVRKSGERIVEIVMENGKVYRAKMFIDATYEGDLMAKAGVSSRSGARPTPNTARRSTASAPRLRNISSPCRSIPT